MRQVAVLLGNLLFVLGTGAMILLPGAFLLTRGQPPADALAALLERAVPQVAHLPLAPAQRAQPAGADPAAGEAAPAVPDVALGAAEAAPDPGRAITSVRIARLPLEAEVVPAHVVQVSGGATWEVPAYKAGHGDFTAGAGEPGNAVLLGHVTSRNAGNVFKDLDRVRSGDTVAIGSAAGEFQYRVTEVRVVSRADLSVLQPTEQPTLTLITCTGAWLPQINEFAERLIVRAELVSP